MLPHGGVGDAEQPLGAVGSLLGAFADYRWFVFASSHRALDASRWPACSLLSCSLPRLASLPLAAHVLLTA